MQEGSRVGVEMTIRCKSFSTQQDPGGVKYFSTKEDTEFNEIAFTVGSGQILPELEEGMFIEFNELLCFKSPNDFYSISQLSNYPRIMLA